jgi:nitrate/TMAO reductase-like tetraheme cytochrome c subunit
MESCSSCPPAFNFHTSHMPSFLSPRFAGAALAAALLTLGAAFAGTTAKSDGKRTADEGPDAAKLWSQNCSRCHNLRPAKSFSDAQWDIFVHHMRVRGNITGSDARLIVEFLKGAN